MANVLSLALRVTADATGLKLDPVQRALVGLGDQADKLTAQFDQFAAGSGAAAAAQADFAARSQELINTLRDNGSATAFAAAFEQLNAEARELAVAFAEGQRVTEANRTEEERRAITLAKLNDLVQKGAIDQETFNRASAEASGANAEAARAAGEAARVQAEAAKVQADALRQRQALEARAASIINANLTAQERYEQSLRELNDLQRQGLLTQEQYNRAVAAARKPLDDAAAASARVADAGKESALQFNELSGIFAILPGPLGNIAGRISGISSASEGLSRIFAGGLGQGVSAIRASFTTLLNPLTLALGSVAAFGAAAVSITRGLVDLESRVKGLGAAADQLGVSFETIQVLEEAASRAGTSIDAAAAGIQKFAARIDDARSGTGAAAEAFRELGISQEELANTAPTELAARVAEELGKIEDPARRAALQVDLLGKSGEQLRRTFAEIPGAADDLEKFGAAISPEDRARIESLGPAFDGIGVALRGLGQSILTPFAGLVEGVADALANAIGAVTNSIRPILEQLSPILDAVGARFSAFGESLFAASQQATIALQPLVSVFEFFSGIVQAAIPGITSALESLFAVVARLTTVFLDSFSAIVNVVGEVFAAFTNLLGFSEVGDFATTIGEAYNFLYESIAQVITIVGNVLEVVNRFATVAFVAIGKVVTTFINLVSVVSEFLGIGAALQAIGSVIAGVFGSVAGVFSTIANAIGGVVGRLLGIAERFLGIDRSAKEAAASTEAISAATDSLNDKAAIAVEQAEKIAAADKARQKELEKQIENVDKLIEASEKQQRIESEFGGSSERFDAAERILAIEAEIARVQELQRAANAAGDTAAAAAAASRLGTLDQVVARERANAEQLAASQETAAEAAAQGFSSGFESAFDAANKGISGLIDKAGEFGNEGAIAAARLQEGIKAAQEQVRAGILNREGFEQEVARQKKLADDRIKSLEQVQKIGEDIAKQESDIRERQFEVDLARLEELNTVRTGSVEVGDIRSGGISAFFATLREDPAVSEAKKQTAELTKLNKNIEKLEARRVDILAGTG
jgi:hypothetical protein